MSAASPDALLALRTRAESVGGTSDASRPDADGMRLLRVTLPVA